MQTTAIGTVANSLPENEVILLTLLILNGYILFAELRNNVVKLISSQKAYYFPSQKHLLFLDMIIQSTQQHVDNQFH